MENRNLDAALERLREELGRLKAGDVVARRHIEQLIADIEGHVSGGVEAQERGPLVASISDAVRRFEVEHPKLTAYLGEIAAALG
ncbi:MAG: hypothetical protein JWR07_4593 [Nevskia sp.]|nr:hypothetical protein [Nevskia sp.]